MPNAISFGARTTRENNYVGVTKPNDLSELGPGTYQLQETLKQSKPSYAPFGSTAARKFSSNTGKELIPGPAAYDTTGNEESVKAKTKEESAPAFKPSGPRFIHKQSDTPGPGQYTIPSTISPAKSNYVQTFDEESEEVSVSEALDLREM